MIRKIIWLLALLVLLASAGGWYISQQTEKFVQQPLTLAQEQIVTVKSGTSFQRLLTQWMAEEWIGSSPFSRLVSRLYPQLTQLKAGSYQLQPGMTLKQALEQINSGKEHQFAITFVEGSRFSEWQQSLAEAPHLKQTITGQSEAEIAKRLSIDRDKLEGLFLAETYHYTSGTTDLEILQRAHNNLSKILDREWQQKQQKLPLGEPYDALILASIIEKETAVDGERRRIASVFINRLNKRMRLQTDPTVIYGMGDKYDGNIRKRDLRTPTPYNTYVISGLPPTPIAMPGEASIAAALNPEQSSYLYFVASGDGGHVFSKTLTEHNRAVRAYLKQLRSK
ncbi:endolytic transglycosylase MltG [Vibrio sp.]|uniref:endolytic transglycosylase MltG n=1 Tax=Vibrio sp. TaxID=678 RepID=UPI003D0CE2EA